MSTDNLVKLHVWLASQGLGSRRSCEQLIKQGKVEVNGNRVRQLGEKIQPHVDEIFVDGQPVRRKTIKKSYFVLNKPKFVMSTHRAEDDRATVFDLPAVKQLPKTMQFVGRLDYESEGMMLLTNDGDLNYKITHPKFNVEKEYLVLTNKKLHKFQLEEVRNGVKVERYGPLASGSIEYLASEKLGKTVGAWYSIKIHEGRKRVIRKMMETLDRKAVRLVRVAIGPIKLSNHIKPGGLMKLSSRQLDALKRVVAE